MMTLALVYVDELPLAGNSGLDTETLELMLSTKFFVKDIGQLRYFLGLEADQSSAGFFVSQHKYLTDLLHDFNMQPIKILIDIHPILTKDLD